MALRPYHRIGLGIVFFVLFWYLGVTIFKGGPTAVPRNIEHNDAANPAEIQSVARPSGRHLSEQQIKTLGLQVRTFQSQKFWIIAETGEYAPESEQARFGRQLQRALVSAGWIESQKVRQRMGSAGFKDTSMYAYSRGGDRGLRIIADPASIVAARALSTALRGISLKTTLERDDNLRNAILIFVGAQ